VPSDPDIEVILADIVDSLESVWAYDPVTGWSTWAPGWGGDLTQIVECKGYWFKMNAPATLTVWGTSALLFE